MRSVQSVRKTRPTGGNEIAWRAAVAVLGASGAVVNAEEYSLRIATWNIENFTALPGMPQFEAAVDVLLRIKPDVVCLQEMNSLTSLEALAAASGFPYVIRSDTYWAMDRTHKPGLISKYPVTDMYVVHARDLSGDTEARDITMNFSVMHISLPGPGPELIAISNHWISGSTDASEFQRSLNAIRTMQLMDRFDSRVIPYFFGVDMNSDILDPHELPWYFYELPPDLPTSFNLGSDMTFPIENSTFAPFQNGTGSQYTAVIDARQTDGSDGTHFNRARIDYLWHSDAMDEIGSEVYNSNNEYLGGGLEKYGDPLPPETSRTASDHLIVFADVMVSTDMLLHAPDPGIAGQVNTLRVEWAEPSDRVYYVYGLQSGHVLVPGCADAWIDISQPQLIGYTIADVNGEARFDVFVPKAAGGRTVRFQAVSKDFCAVTNAVSHLFD